MICRWPSRWQKILINKGYRSSWIHLHKCKSQALDIWYKDMTQAMQEHSYFPPVLIGHGLEAWRACQKYVSNKPVSGLVLIHRAGEDKVADDIPCFTFEPHFPLLVVAPLNKIPLFLQEQVDHVLTDSPGGHDLLLQHTLDWMNDVNM
ncbi:uncharacterized protein BX664DRAFT_332356 [Halteromyces radiatus]|uniref:uncharacterized protein n=1 Tax=Halteromyces radiatus TaxID=101107 RepID=UPI002220CCB5|nr:uncharacterized protein BX664DRAFT_332356 [Halteromyces radiatus]KAI8089175.1 hypothetical protein BX664DRAFT_332356 [Halteromyces radiatus]